MVALIYICHYLFTGPQQIFIWKGDFEVVQYGSSIPVGMSQHIMADQTFG